MITIKTVIVDDEARIRRGIERLVKSFGDEWEIIGTYSDGKEAYETIINNHINVDLVITDVKMPEMDGLSLVRNLKKTHSFFAFFISGFDDFQYLQSAIREGAINYILKPIDREQFRTELQEVKEKVMKKRIEQQDLKEAYEKASQLKYIKQVRLLSEMTWMEDKDVSMLNWNEEFPIGNYELAYISIDQVSMKTKEVASREWEVWNFAIENILEETLKNEFYNEKIWSWWWRNGKFNYWVLLNQQSKIDSHSLTSVTDQFIKNLQQNIRDYTPYTASVSVGNEFQDIMELPNYKNKLLSLLQFRIIHGGNNIFKYDFIKNELEQKTKGISSGIYMRTQQIMFRLEQKDEEKVLESLQAYFNEIETLSSPGLVEEAINYLFIKIVNIWIDHDGYCVDPYLLDEAMQITKQATSFNQLKDRTKYWILSMMKKIQSLKDNQPDSIQQAKQWINANLGENITVKRIAEYVYMNPTYFCEYFKNMTGVTVLDYVTKKRLEKAKELLEVPDIKIYDISSSVGYHDAKYFSQLFKKWQGYSPSQYRDNFLKRSSLE
ncbi:transcriptional regulatory protein [Mycobacteroides abscessus subsp. abscessus]|nr:transcriptional regulatory protein [Mycobacteroides abscessus subsp. abscessus]